MSFGAQGLPQGPGALLELAAVAVFASCRRTREERLSNLGHARKVVSDATAEALRSASAERLLGAALLFVDSYAAAKGAGSAPFPCSARELEAALDIIYLLIRAKGVKAVLSEIRGFASLLQRCAARRALAALPTAPIASPLRSPRPTLCAESPPCSRTGRARWMRACRSPS